MKKTQKPAEIKLSPHSVESITLPFLSHIGARAERVVELFQRLCNQLRTGEELNILRGLTYCVYVYKIQLMVYVRRFNFSSGPNDLIISYEMIIRSMVKLADGTKFSFLDTFEQAITRLNSSPSNPCLVQKRLMRLLLTTDNLLHYGALLQQNPHLNVRDNHAIVKLCAEQTRFFIAAFTKPSPSLMVTPSASTKTVVHAYKEEVKQEAIRGTDASGGGAELSRCLSGVLFDSQHKFESSGLCFYQDLSTHYKYFLTEPAELLILSDDHARYFNSDFFNSDCYARLVTGWISLLITNPHVPCNDFMQRWDRVSNDFATVFPDSADYKLLVVLHVMHKSAEGRVKEYHSLLMALFLIRRLDLLAALYQRIFSPIYPANESLLNDNDRAYVLSSVVERQALLLVSQLEYRANSFPNKTISDPYDYIRMEASLIKHRFRFSLSLDRFSTQHKVNLFYCLMHFRANRSGGEDAHFSVEGYHHLNCMFALKVYEAAFIIGGGPDEQDKFSTYISGVLKSEKSGSDFILDFYHGASKLLRILQRLYDFFSRAPDLLQADFSINDALSLVNAKSQEQLDALADSIDQSSPKSVVSVLKEKNTHQQLTRNQRHQQFIDVILTSIGRDLSSVEKKSFIHDFYKLKPVNKLHRKQIVGLFMVGSWSAIVSSTRKQLADILQSGLCQAKRQPLFESALKLIKHAESETLANFLSSDIKHFMNWKSLLEQSQSYYHQLYQGSGLSPSPKRAKKKSLNPSQHHLFEDLMIRLEELTQSSSEDYQQLAHIKQDYTKLSEHLSHSQQNTFQQHYDDTVKDSLIKRLHGWQNRQNGLPVASIKLKKIIRWSQQLNKYQRLLELCFAAVDVKAAVAKLLNTCKYRLVRLQFHTGYLSSLQAKVSMLDSTHEEFVSRFSALFSKLVCLNGVSSSEDIRGLRSQLLARLHDFLANYVLRIRSEISAYEHRWTFTVFVNQLQTRLGEILDQLPQDDVVDNYTKSFRYEVDEVLDEHMLIVRLAESTRSNQRFFTDDSPLDKLLARIQSPNYFSSQL